MARGERDRLAVSPDARMRNRGNERGGAPPAVLIVIYSMKVRRLVQHRPPRHRVSRRHRVQAPRHLDAQVPTSSVGTLFTRATIGAEEGELRAAIKSPPRRLARVDDLRTENISAQDNAGAPSEPAPTLMPRGSAIFTSSARDLASILRMTAPR